MSNKVLKESSAALTLFALIISCIASSAEGSLGIDILSLGISFCYWLLSISAGSSQSISYIGRRKVGNKYSKSLSKSFKFGYGLISLLKASSIFLFRIDLLMTIT